MVQRENQCRSKDSRESILYVHGKDDSLETILRTLSKINPIKYTFDDNNRVTISSVEP